MEKYLAAIKFFKDAIKEYPDLEKYYCWALRGVVEVAICDKEIDSDTQFDMICDLAYDEDYRKVIDKI